MKFYLLLVFFLFGFEPSTPTQENTDVVISRGAVLNRLPQVLVYDQLNFIFFVIPDIPEPPKLTSIVCRPGMDAELCDMFRSSKAVMGDIKDVLRIINRVLTTKGLNDAPIFEPVKMGESWVETITGVDVKSESPQDQLKDVVGEDYLSQVEMRLALRKILGLNTSALSGREKRFVGAMMPAISLAKQVVQPGDLAKLFQGLFTGDHGILRTLAMFRAASPEKKKSFTDLTQRISEFESETKRLFIDVLKKTDSLDMNITRLQKSKEYFALSMAGLKEYVLMTQTLISDVMRYLFTTNVYNMHFLSYTECRAGKVSPIFVPPTLLQSKLKDLERSLPDEVELLFSSSNVNQYYRLQTASCIYDSSGGLMKIVVPLKRRQSTYQIFEYRPIQFGFSDQSSTIYTCALDTPATYVIKDGYSNEIYPVNELEINECDVESELCRLPLSADQDTASVCIAILLKGLPAERIKENCRLQCTERKRASLTNVAPDVFVGVHLPKTGVSLRCPDKNVTITGVDIGSTQISLECSDCRIYWDGRLVGEPTSIPCSGRLPAKVSTLLPIHFTTLNDLKPVLDDGQERTVFSNINEIFNEYYNPVGEKSQESVGIWSKFVGIWHIVQDQAQSIAIGVLIYKNHFVLGASLEMIRRYINNGQLLVEAASDYTCKLPSQVNFIFYATFILALCTFVRPIIRYLHRVVKKQWDNRLELEAHRRFIESNQV